MKFNSQDRYIFNDEFSLLQDIFKSKNIENEIKHVLASILSRNKHIKTVMSKALA